LKEKGVIMEMSQSSSVDMMATTPEMLSALTSLRIPSIQSIPSIGTTQDSGDVEGNQMA